MSVTAAGPVRLPKATGRYAAWTGGFTLLEVMLATAILGIVVAALVGAVTILVRLNQALSERARVEAAVSIALSSILQGSPERPGLVSATELLAVGNGQLKYKAKYEEKVMVYEYVHDPARRELVLRIRTADSVPVLEVPVLDQVETFTTSRAVAGDRVVVRIELAVGLPTAHGVTTWRVSAEGVPRNGVL